MKIIHCADVHLGSKIESKFPKEKSDERKVEIRAAFNRMVQYAKDNGISIIILAGDIFDSDRPLKKDKEFFYSVVKNNPDIDFLYLRGNHDIMEFYTEYGLTNLKTFSNEWVTYTYDDVAITGIENNNENATSMYSSLKLEKNKKNIVLLHGQLGETCGKNIVNLTKLHNKNIDYLAMGHIHRFSSTKIDERGICVYSGCLEGRGFDECGDKGFVEIDVGDTIDYRFIKNSFRSIVETTVDISETGDLYSACQKVKSFIKCTTKDIVRVIVTGEVQYDIDGLDREIEKMLAPDYYWVSVKNKVVRKFDITAISGDVSLKGEFIRTVLECKDYSEEEKAAIISCGLHALSGREVD